MFESIVDLARWIMKWVVSLPERRREQARREYAIWRHRLDLRRTRRKYLSDKLSQDKLQESK